MLQCTSFRLDIINYWPPYPIKIKTNHFRCLYKNQWITQAAYWLYYETTTLFLLKSLSLVFHCVRSFFVYYAIPFSKITLDLPLAYRCGIEIRGEVQPRRQRLLLVVQIGSHCTFNCGRSVVSPGIPVSPTNKTDRHDIAEILLKVALNIIIILIRRDLG
jgi:hypothetical protein